MLHACYVREFKQPQQGRRAGTVNVDWKIYLYLYSTYESRDNLESFQFVFHCQKYLKA